ncbi:hypothetical protein [Adhaeribacter rhizoryzae]|uniref:Uncharacterized protein n=1 Tax=Adhaeribacter rhizoryzae TaxID=2607907 RepID=A0A5M6D2E8_9BACT|nr:hypothetical protein [Adhaeribacter rhizoryzae]KAA5541186.1 hypothetical protein F0145_21390 [Adhaeribacter rhizoryzae]
MNLQVFERLPLEERLQLVWNEGNQLGIRFGRRHNVCLYHLQDFFAEIWLDPEEQSVSMVRAFTSTKCLEPYLSHINISELLTEHYD